MSDREDVRSEALGRYRLWSRPAQTPRVIDSQRRDDERVVAICSKRTDAEMIVRALNAWNDRQRAERSDITALPPREKTCPSCGGTGCEDCDGSGIALDIPAPRSDQ